MSDLIERPEAYPWDAHDALRREAAQALRAKDKIITDLECTCDYKDAEIERLQAENEVWAVLFLRVSVYLRDAQDAIIEALEPVSDDE
jgi:hypothetical protein